VSVKDTGNFIVSTALISAVLGLGIWRLDFDRSAPAVTEQQRGALARCVPPAELAAGAKLSVTLGNTVPAARSGNVPVPVPPSTLAFVGTTAIKLDGTAASGTAEDPLRLRKTDGGFELQGIGVCIASWALLGFWSEVFCSSAFFRSSLTRAAPLSTTVFLRLTSAPRSLRRCSPLHSLPLDSPFSSSPLAGWISCSSGGNLHGLS
jgi:hypothetical protein